MPQAQIANHVLTRSEIIGCLGSYAETHPEFQDRGGVWLIPTTDAEELFIGVHFDDSIRKSVTDNNPLQRLTAENLDAFCIVVEEVSHFHLIINRAKSGLEVSKLELESQGEIDKLLLAALFLEKQIGDGQVVQLARKLYDEAAITAVDTELYWQATKFAARFWFEQARNDLRSLNSTALKKLLRQIYRQNWSGKQECLNSPPVKIAS
jgi:hypothetical protein